MGLLATLALRAASPADYAHAEWQSPSVLGINKLPPRNAAWPCPDAASGWKSNYDTSPWILSLDGQWSYHWAPDPWSRPETFFEPNYDVAHWDTITVPSCVELEGLRKGAPGEARYGTPIYTNYIFPFVARPPFVLDEPRKDWTTFLQRDPISSYRRTFVVPADWTGGRTLLHFAGVASAMYVWVNGHKIGFSVNSRVPAEFDITESLRPGANTLAVEVYHYAASSYLEDQDMWRLSGIFRDVFLYHTPSVSLWDFYVDPALDANYRDAAMSLHYSLRTAAASQALRSGLRIRMTLRAPDGSVVTGHPLIDEAAIPPADGIGSEKVSAAIPIQAPLLWTNETPNVYDALVELVQNGKTIEARRVDVGFRKVEIHDRQFFINGRPIKIKGVNRHEWDPATGYTVSRARMEEDARLIKQDNFNFVRTSHYSDDPRWYELCNRYGIFLMAENNLETHGISYMKRILPGDDPVWLPAVVDRMRRAVIRDRNNPSIVIWSMGNEAGYGNDWLAVRAETVADDPQHRPIHYADMNAAADMDSQTYPTTDWLLLHVQNKAVRKGEHDEIALVAEQGKYPSNKPFVANEYAHGLGNAQGNFADYWDVFEKYPMLIGGFIWDWADLTPYATDRQGRRFFAYGGDFGDEPNSHNPAKGLVSADRIPHPAYWEVKQVQDYIKTTAVDLAHGQVRVLNKYDFVSLAGFAGEWVLEENGKPAGHGALRALDLKPGESAVISIPWGKPSWRPGVEYFLTVRFRLRQSTPWAKAGQMVAWDQMAVPNAAGATAPAVSPAADQVTLSRNGADWVASAGGTVVRIDGTHGWLASMSVGGTEALEQPLRPDFWRVPTENDLGWKLPQKMGAWKESAQNLVLTTLDAAMVSGGAQIRAAYRVPVSTSTAVVTYLLRGDGTLRCDLVLKLGPNSPEIPRVGMQLALPGKWDRIDWFGRGPQENYRDRKTGAAVGLYQARVADWVTHYVIPQDNANRTDIRWIEFAGADGAGLRVKANGPLLGVAAWPYSSEDLAQATHDYQLPRREFTTVNLDGFQIGVGGDNSWGLQTHDQYRLKNQTEFEFAFVLEGIRAR